MPRESYRRRLDGLRSDVERSGEYGVNIAARTLYVVANDTERLY
jgi:hypothetical protein